MKIIARFLSIFLIGLMGFSPVVAQETDAAVLKSILQNKSFTFRAQSAWPLQGTVVQLTAGYDMKILQDSINTYLPYFGRAYTSNYTTENGIKFISKKFDYKLKEKHKGGWDLTIRPTDTRDITELTYSISGNGYATLQVISNNRQAISFYGVIEKR
ncbi:DUF4251 domain-containing protein [Flavisolibacter sp. BT320]|nr:DUF4251 domain-containing protein [Flavisolibacter longurius]